MGFAKTALRNLLGMIEPLALHVAPRLEIPPIFIVGLPRVGETLSPAAPSQGYRFWKLHTKAFGSVTGIPEAERRRVRDTVYALQGLARGPFINKWQANSLRIALLDELFPGCVFVKITRDDMATAESILRARRANPAGEQAWFSVRPAALADTDHMTVYDQIAAQMAETHSALSNSLAHIDPSRILRSRYTDIYTDPNRWLKTLSQTYHAATGTPLEILTRVTRKLGATTTSRISEDDRKQLAAALDKANMMSMVAEEGS